MSKKRAPQTTIERHRALTGLGRDSYVSQSGIHKLLASVDEEGIPEAHSRSTQYRARKVVCSEPTRYGPLVESVEMRSNTGEPLSVAIQNPLAMLDTMTSKYEAFGRMFLDRLEKKPCTPQTPWKIILYQDGVNPSDGLSKNVSRKSAAFYWSLLELGMDNLCQEVCWMTVCLCRESIVKNLEGGFPALTAVILKSFFDPDGHDLEYAGVSLTINGQQIPFFLLALASCWQTGPP